MIHQLPEPFRGATHAKVGLIADATYTAPR